MWGRLTILANSTHVYEGLITRSSMPPSTCDAMMDETLNRCCAWTGSHAYRTVHVEPDAIRPRCMDIAA